MHSANILIHIVSGTIALLLGLIAIFSIKGGRVHQRSGRYFLGFMTVVIITGLIGVIVFGRNTFLAVITVLSGYVAYSGYRVLLFKSNEPRLLDIAVAILSILVLVYFLNYFQSIGMIWSPVIIYSTVGALAFVLTYDFLRYLIPSEAYRRHRIWLYEHIYKMMSAFAALLSAFSGTVLEEYHPHSQYLPSVVGLLIAFSFMYYVYRFGLQRPEKQD